MNDASTNDHFEFVDAMQDLPSESIDDSLSEVVPPEVPAVEEVVTPPRTDDDAEHAAEEHVVLPQGANNDAGHMFQDALNDLSQQMQADGVLNQNDGQGTVLENSTLQDSGLQEGQGVLFSSSATKNVDMNSTPDLLSGNNSNVVSRQKDVAG
ncbi:hypothetical protein V6N12_044691 [Hibiscus sabdariffa]|uniref:Uncharacterized protein n=1 Tax=Hibiscus sabdariffa TaxID=183260 RepID=A0ABR2ARZ0_9ROSI